MRRFVAAVASGAGVLGVILVSCADDSTLPAPDQMSDSGDATITDGAPELDALDTGSDVEIPLVDTCGDAGVVSGAWVGDPHLCLSVFAEAATNARQFAFAPNGDLFVEGSGFILALSDLNKNGVISPDESTTYVPPLFGLNHGLAFSPDGAFVYASSESTIFRWAYSSGDRVAAGPEQIVIKGMPTGGHASRTLVFDAQGRLYVNVGSLNDVELEADLALRSQVRRFTIPNMLPAGGIAYDSGEVFASGLRNEVGLAFDSKGRLWGVENGSDGMYIPAAAADEPAEEINRLDAPGTRFYGFPRCWPEFGFAGGMGPGTQRAYLTPDATTDTWCRDAKNVQSPAGAMRAHWAPLGVTEYSGRSLPWKGDLFVAAHGSAPGRLPKVGRVIARAHLVGDKVMSVTPIVGHLVDGGLEQGTWDARPVDIRMGPDGALYFSDDNASRIFRLGYKP